MDFGYSLAPPCRGASNRLAEAFLTSIHNLCFEQKFLPENFQFLDVKCSIYVLYTVDSRYLELAYLE